ncbi:MAG: hypothetical protein LBS59_01825, partial [Puniceicoccales bacterium]|nr:hypothetical protein [Puniceicoccales bacterium]
MASSPFRSPVLFQCRFLSEAASLSACSRQCPDSAAQTGAFLVLGVAYVHGALGQQTTLTEGAGTRTFAYDELTQSLTQEIFSGTVNGTLNRTYDTYNRPTGYVLLDAANPTTAVTAATYAYDTTGNFSHVQGDTVPAQFSTSNYTTTALTPATFTYNRENNSDLLANVVGPVHTVFNTYETNRDVITSKQNKVTVGTNAT